MNLNKLIELAKLIPKAFERPQEVIEGFTNELRLNMGKLPENEEEEIVRRRLICAACPHNSVNAVDAGYVTHRTDSHCTLCYCNIAGKTACLTCNCGADVYNKANPNEPPADVRWTEFNTNK